MLSGVLGRMYISQNILGFYSSFPEKMEKILFARVSDVQKERGMLFSGIAITCEKAGVQTKV